VVQQLGTLGGAKTMLSELAGYTACYVRTEHGYMGQLLEWPEVVTEGADIEECERSLEDAINEMVVAYKEQGKPIPVEHAFFQTIMVEV
jgi:predicted RNase H-like HicB family nuclease